jgi:hypothetical protein
VTNTTTGVVSLENMVFSSDEFVMFDLGGR